MVCVFVAKYDLRTEQMVEISLLQSSKGPFLVKKAKRDFGLFVVIINTRHLCTTWNDVERHRGQFSELKELLAFYMCSLYLCNHVFILLLSCKC